MMHKTKCGLVLAGVLALWSSSVVVDARKTTSTLSYSGPRGRNSSLRSRQQRRELSSIEWLITQKIAAEEAEAAQVTAQSNDDDDNDDDNGNRAGMGMMGSIKGDRPTPPPTDPPNVPQEPPTPSPVTVTSAPTETPAIEETAAPTEPVSPAPTAVASSASPTETTTTAPVLSLETVVLDDFFVAYVIPSLGREPTPAQYAALFNATLEYFEACLTFEFANPTNIVKLVDLTATRGDDVYNFGIPVDRFNLYAEYDALTLSYVSGFVGPDADETFALLQECITDEYIQDVVRVLNPFQSTNEVIMRKVGDLSAVPTAAPVMPPPTNQTLLDLIESTPTLSTLLSAIETADTNRNMPPFLASLLDNPASSLTIFAPVNSAFIALNTLVPGYLTKLLTPEFGLHLFNILGYHVTQGEIPTSRFPLSNLQMLQSGTVNVTGTTNAFQVQTFSPDPALILPPPNQMASNGIAHLVDNVLLPQFLGQDLVSALQALNATQGGRFSAWLQLIAASGLAPQLTLEEGVTFLAPTNDAITADAAEFLLRSGNEDVLRSVILYHVIDEVFNFAAQAVPNILLVNTLQDENIVVGLVILDDNSVLANYNQASQTGVFLTQENIGYVIDRLLVPRSLADVVPDAVVEAAFDATVISLLEAEVVPP